MEGEIGGKEKHSKIKHSCIICGKLFLSSSKLLIHEKSYACEIYKLLIHERIQIEISSKGLACLFCN